MKKITASNYKKDKYYKSVTNAVHELLKEKSFVAPVDLFMQMGKLSKEDYEDWRFKRIPHITTSMKQDEMTGKSPQRFEEPDGLRIENDEREKQRQSQTFVTNQNITCTEGACPTFFPCHAVIAGI